MKDILALFALSMIITVVVYTMAEGDHCNLPVLCLSPNIIKQCYFQQSISHKNTLGDFKEKVSAWILGK
jgi:hypothetical protein